MAGERKEEVLVQWDKNRKWEEIKETELEYYDLSGCIKIKPGVRYYMSETCGEKQSLWSQLCAMFISFFFCGIVPLLLILAAISWYSVRARWICITSFLLLFIPIKTYDKSVLLWKGWKCLFEYYSYSIVFDEAMDINKKYLFAEYPHGVSPIGCVVSGFIFPHFCPDVPCYSLTTGSALMVPGYGALLQWIGSVPATNENLRKSLGLGSCAVVVDGIAGMYAGEPDRERIKFSGRKGFIRAAVETGSSIIPVYQFGTSSLMRMVPKSLEHIARKLKCAMGLVIGRWGLPIPKRSPLMTCLGRALEVKKMSREDPHFDAYVDEVQQRVADEIQRLYYKYRGVFGWSDRPLEIYCFVC